MSVDIAIRVPDELNRQLERFRDRLPEVLERGLRDIQAEDGAPSGDARAIVTLLASRPTPEEVLALRPSDQMQARVGELLDRGKQEGLSRAEEAELDRFLFLEHLVRLAKARALEDLTSGE